MCERFAANAAERAAVVDVDDVRRTNRRRRISPSPDGDVAA